MAKINSGPSRGPSPKQKLRSLLRELKNSYLDGCGKVGGNSVGYRQIVLDDLAARPNVYHQHILELVTGQATAIWEEQLRPSNHKQPSLPGLEQVFDLTIYDKSDIGSYLKVLVGHATLAHLRDDATIKYGKIAQATAIASYEMELYWKLMKATGGNEGMRVIDAHKIFEADDKDELPPSPYPDPGPEEDDD